VTTIILDVNWVTSSPYTLPSRRDDVIALQDRIRERLPWAPLPEAYQYFETRVILNNYAQNRHTYLIGTPEFRHERATLTRTIENSIRSRIHLLQRTIVGFRLPRPLTVFRGVRDHIWNHHTRRSHRLRGSIVSIYLPGTEHRVGVFFVWMLSAANPP